MALSEAGVAEAEAGLHARRPSQRPSPGRQPPGVRCTDKENLECSFASNTFISSQQNERLGRPRITRGTQHFHAVCVFGSGSHSASLPHRQSRPSTSHFWGLKGNSRDSGGGDGSGEGRRERKGPAWPAQVSVPHVSGSRHFP